MRAYWERDEENIADRAVLGAIAKASGLERDGFMRVIDSEAVRDELKSITGRAAERGVFGRPDVFRRPPRCSGKDRLDSSNAGSPAPSTESLTSRAEERSLRADGTAP